MEKENLMVFDFTKVTVEVNIDEFVDVDVSKNLGNFIHGETIDIGMDDVARKIYRQGKAEIPVEYIEEIKRIVRGSRFLAPVKVAIIKLLTI